MIMLDISYRDYYDDFELCNQAVKQIMSSHHQESEILAQNMSPDERVIVLVWGVTGIIENGGFRLLFESPIPGDQDFNFTLDAFNSVECDNAVLVLKEALCLFPKCTPPNDRDMRINKYMEWPEDIRCKIDRKFLKLTKNITEHLANYIRSTCST